MPIPDPNYKQENGRFQKNPDRTLRAHSTELQSSYIAAEKDMDDAMTVHDAEHVPERLACVITNVQPQFGTDGAPIVPEAGVFQTWVCGNSGSRRFCFSSTSTDVGTARVSTVNEGFW